MDALLDYIEEGKAADKFDTAKLASLVCGLVGGENETYLDLEKLDLCMGRITSVATCSALEGSMFLKVVLPALFSEEELSQTVPDLTTTAAEPHNRASPASRRAPVSSMAEGSRLRQRNLAAMTNDEYDVRAASIQPSLVNSISSFAAQKGLGPSAQRNLAVDTARDAGSGARATFEQPTYSDSL
ncbi:hypothetical protein GGH91_004184, partial [Coemansia sp. RSA 2671]